MNRLAWGFATFIVCFSGSVLADDVAITSAGGATAEDFRVKDAGIRESNSGFYLGAGLSSNQLTACPKTPAADCPNPFTSNAQQGANLRVLGGYSFSKHFAVEAEFADLGTFDVQNDLGSVTGEAKAAAISIAAKGTITFHRGWSIFGKAGLASTRIQYSAKPGWVLTGWASSQSSVGLLLGAGGQYDFNNSVSIRLWMMERPTVTTDTPASLAEQAYIWYSNSDI